MFTISHTRPRCRSSQRSRSRARSITRKARPNARAEDRRAEKAGDAVKDAGDKAKDAADKAGEKGRTRSTGGPCGSHPERAVSPAAFRIIEAKARVALIVPIWRFDQERFVSARYAPGRS
jgi:hypothetical protein